MRQVPRAQPVYLLYREVDWPRLAAWAEEECRGFTPLSVREGIPNGWLLASCSEVTGDHRVRSEFPELALPERVRLALIGGIRSGPGVSFFPFAPPGFAVEGGDGHESVLCNGLALHAAPGTRSYRLPDGLPVETRISVEVVRGGEPVKSRSIYLTGQYEWRLVEPQLVLDRLGRSTNGATDGVAGAFVTGQHPSVDGFSPPLMLTPGVEGNASRVLFVGRLPGQIYSWPAEPHVSGWSPVWAIPMGRRGRAIYCGGTIDAAQPVANGLDGDLDHIHLWRLTLWHRRKRIKPPDDPDLAQLWNLYVEAARRV
jgi:hypothetical protein